MDGHGKCDDRERALIIPMYNIHEQNNKMKKKNETPSNSKLMIATKSMLRILYTDLFVALHVTKWHGNW